MQRPESYTETPEGLLIIADGINPMKRWDGSASAVQPVGVTAPATAPAVAGGGVGALTGTYFAFVRYVNERGSVSDLSAVSASATVAGVLSINYSAVPVSGQANVVRRQILRNTDGETDTFYVDVDTTDLTSSAFSSTRADADLSSQTAVALFDDQGNILANLHGVPPSHKSVVAHHSGRLFAAVDRYYSRGSCRLTNGSATVAGVNTAWTANMAGRELWVVGSTARYTVAAVDAAAQTLTLTGAYAGSSDEFALYTIRPAPAERRLVYYTEASDPEAWPAINAVSLQEDGDEITGLMPLGSFLYVLCSRHVYRYTFQADPGVDGFVYLDGERGCVNDRCWATADGTAYLLDHQGIHAFGEGDASGSQSDAVVELFRGGSSAYAGPRINWLASELFHCVHSPDDRILRWFVCLSGEYAPRWAVAYNYRDKRFWLEEYDSPVTASVAATLQGRRRVYAAGLAGTFVLDEGTLDGLDARAGTTRGTATSGDAWGLSDSGNYLFWPEASLLVGRPVTIVEGRGAGQRRTVAAVSGSRLQTKSRWSVAPDATSVYQLGGVGWEWKSGWMRYARDEENNPRKVEVLHRVTQTDHSLVLRLYEDFKEAPIVQRVTRKAREAEGFSARAGSADLVATAANTGGFVQQRTDRQKEGNVTGPRFLGVSLSGATGPERQAIYQVAVDGVDG